MFSQYEEDASSSIALTKKGKTLRINSKTLVGSATILFENHSSFSANPRPQLPLLILFRLVHTSHSNRFNFAFGDISACAELPNTTSLIDIALTI
jgi:prepilin-type processing-associated H-X9-DG protein